MSYLTIKPDNFKLVAIKSVYYYSYRFREGYKEFEICIEPTFQNIFMIGLYDDRSDLLLPKERSKSLDIFEAVDWANYLWNIYLEGRKNITL